MFYALILTIKLSIKMQRIFLLICISLFWSSAVAQSFDISFDQKEYFEESNHYELINNLPDGLYKVYYDSIKLSLAYKGLLDSSKKEGDWIYYSEEGYIRRIEKYLSGALIEEVISYYPTGEISMVVQISNGVKEGSIVRYYQNGSIKLEGNYYQNQPTGSWKFYSEEGELLKEEQY